MWLASYGAFVLPEIEGMNIGGMKPCSLTSEYLPENGIRLCEDKKRGNAPVRFRGRNDIGVGQYEKIHLGKQE